jgi:hypothetical protein
MMIVQEIARAQSGTVGAFAFLVTAAFAGWWLYQKPAFAQSGAVPHQAACLIKPAGHLQCVEQLELGNLDPQEHSTMPAPGARAGLPGGCGLAATSAGWALKHHGTPSSRIRRSMKGSSQSR